MAFGHPITDFGLMRHKIGEMAIRVYVSESMVYRTAGMIDRNLAGVDTKDTEACLKRIEEYDVECSMVKVWCSEMLDYVVDETVQIYGGAGYVEDYPAERHWRDARINRIFEGTNEINRLLVPGRLIRRAMKGELPIFEKAMALMEEVTSGPPAAAAGAFLAAEARMVAGAKKIALMCLGLAAQKFGQEPGRRAGDPGPLRRHRHGDLRARERGAADAEARGGPGRRPDALAGGGRALLRAGRHGPHRGLGAAPAGRGGRGRHAAHLPRGAAALHQARDAEHGRAAATGGDGGDRGGGSPRGMRTAAPLLAAAKTGKTAGLLWRRLIKRGYAVLTADGGAAPWTSSARGPWT